MKVAEYIAEILAAQRVPAVFELVGGMITHMLDAVQLKGKTPIISMRHEQGAAFAAEGCSRMLGRPAVAMATSGPGATNLLTGIASCYFDSTPTVFITGQVNRHEQKGDRRIRQLGFQETDIVSMAAPVTKRAWRVNRESEIPAIFREAFQTAVSGRPGPVLIDIPMDIQHGEIDAAVEACVPAPIASNIDEADARTILRALLAARMPMILAGGGIRGGNAVEAFRRFVGMAGVPVVHSLMAVDLLPYHHPLNVGMIGSYGNRWANLALAQCDCLLVLGSRLDVRQTGADTRAFKGDRAIFHIDCEAGEMNNRVQNCHAIESELAPALDLLNEVFAPRKAQLEQNSRAWLQSIATLRLRWPDTSESTRSEINGSASKCSGPKCSGPECPGLKSPGLRGSGPAFSGPKLSGQTLLGQTLLGGINPNAFMHSLSRAMPAAGAYVCDVGQNQMWAAQSLELREGQRFLTSGGLGSMGFALPAAIGAAIAVCGAPIVVIAGDGGFQCNIQELETVAHLQLPLKIVVINNGCHGMVRQFQESHFESRYQSTVFGYSTPDFAKVAGAYGIAAHTICNPHETRGGVDWLARQGTGPSLLQVMVPQSTNAYPKLAFGHGLESMEPFVKSLDMESA